MSEYWVYTWLDSHRIRTFSELKAGLASASLIEDLKQSAGLVIESWRTSSVTARPRSLIAGAGIDLSGRLDCNATSCRRAQVDRLFRRAWHYFETIVARDAIAEDLVVHRNCPDAEIRERLIPHFETILMVQELGAEGLVEFLPRVPACFKHWRKHAKEAGIGDIAERETEIINQLLPETSIALERGVDGVCCIVDNPDFSHTQWVDFPPEKIRGKTDRQMKRDALRTVARKFLVHLTADVNAARKYGGAFGSTIPTFQKLLANRGEKVSSVAFEVELPALDGLSTAQLIEVRVRYHDTFTRFRKRVGSFLEECVRQGVTQRPDIQAKLKADLIDGELEELKLNLKQAEESLRRKSTYALCLGSIVATIGVTTGIITPPVAFGLAATVSAASLSPGVSRYVDDMVKLKSDDMYFLLQAEEHQH
ncbi:MAG TPA: hypothetical protein VK687_08075 [Bryobacteraceae bacterium]|jgi:hypothetical protein|nr:hypothetical protein [Bryobacteraceae bacterium]